MDLLKNLDFEATKKQSSFFVPKLFEIGYIYEKGYFKPVDILFSSEMFYMSSKDFKGNDYKVYFK